VAVPPRTALLDDLFRNITLYENKAESATRKSARTASTW
jgi:hypothetical protein